MMTQVYMASLRGEKPSPPDTDDDEYNPSTALKALGLGVSAGAVGLYATYQGLRLGVNVTQMLLEGALALHDAMQSQQQEEAEDENIGQDVDEINSSPPITVNSSPPMTVNSSSSASTQRSKSRDDEDVEIDEAWMRGRSRSRDSTPDRGYPKKK